MSAATQDTGAAAQMPDAGPVASAESGEAMSLADAYRHCESVTRAQAANFYWGIRLLPAERRRAMCAVYAFARRIDDIGDGALPHERKGRELDAQAQALARRAQGSGDDPVMIALADADARFTLPADALPALIDGVRMDVDGAAYESFDDLVLYCRRVAGAVGRACLAIFALRDARPSERVRAEGLADDLGVALQLTNILRDLREDAENGRVYLPAEDLRRFGVVGAGEESVAAQVIAQRAHARPPTGNGGAGQAAWVRELVGFEAERAQRWFDRGTALVPLLDRPSAACVLAMAGIYRRLLGRIAADPERVLRERVRLSAHQKALVATRSLLGAGAPARER